MLTTLASQNPRRRPSRREAGFTIVEVTIASVVLLLALGSSITALHSGLLRLEQARYLTLASQIAQSEIESIRLADWSHLPASGEISINNVYGLAPSMASRFTGSRVITPTTGKTDSMRDITITIAWRDKAGRSQSRVYLANYAKNGIYDYDYTKAR